MKAIVTVGLGFGDEGKGATVDYLTRLMDAELVVRYCGGAQAGHNVQLPDGRRHTFSQFGAGTLAGARTFLGPRVIINPATLKPEANHLRSLDVNDPFSLLTVHEDCLVSTTYHVAMNRLRELDRGRNRHGSCGLGIGETRHYWLRYGQDAIVAKDLHDRSVLRRKLALLRDRFLLEMQTLNHLDPEWSALLYTSRPNEEADLLQIDSADVRLVDRMPDAEVAIFEGSQGVLLDEYKGFHPYTTWSTVTPRHALEILNDVANVDTTVLGITRAYSTRHGEGPFPSYCEEMTSAMIDPGNPSNDWQGKIRFGSLDLVLLEYAARVAQVDGMVVNGIDQLPSCPRVVSAYTDCDRIDEPQSINQQQTLTQMLLNAVAVNADVSEDAMLDLIDRISPVVCTAYGPTYEDRTGGKAMLSKQTTDTCEV